MLRKDPFITGEYYHIYNRGVDKRDIFKSKVDYERFMILLSVSNNQDPIKLDNLINILHKTYSEIITLEKSKAPLVSVGSWCLMDNHFHLLVKQEIDGGITKFMRKLSVGYSMYFNKKYERQGALFSGPFKSKCIKNDDNYMRQLFAYIHLNPLDLKFFGWEKELKQSSLDMKKFLEEYRYSSYPDYLEMKRVENNILSQTSFPDYFQNKQSFQTFVENYFIPTS
jgi:putative transposase